MRNQRVRQVMVVRGLSRGPAALLSCAFLFSIAAHAQFTSSTQLVTLNMSAKDKQGKPLLGLKASDVTLTEDGKKQKIAVFEYQNLEDTILPALPETKPVRGPARATPPATLSAKLGEIQYKDRRLLVLYFDMTSMPVQDQIRAQESAMKFLSTQITSSDMVAVMTFTSGLNLLQDFTADRDALSKAINGLIVGEGSDMAVAGATAGDDSGLDTGAAYTADDTEFNIFNTDRKLVALQSAVKMLGALPEKKALVYFSSGVNKSGVENEAQMRATTNAAVRANVALYPIDARGLIAVGPNGDSTKPAAGGQGMLSGASAGALAGKIRSSQETLHTLAADTGGKELVDNSDLAMGIVEAQKQISSYYIVGYYSTNQTLDGQYRRIKVQMSNNDRTAKLDYRPGYFAGKEFKQFTASDRERQLQEALLLGDPMTELSLAMEIDHFRLTADRYFVPVQVKMPGSEIDLTRHGGAETSRLDFIAQVKDSKGKVIRSVRDNLEVRLKGVTAADLAKKSLAYDTGFTLAPGAYSIKFLARENGTGKMGTFESSFTVPDLATEQTWQPISSVVLSNQMEARSAAIASGAQDKKTIAEHPLIQDGQKMVPSVTRVFRKDQSLYVYLEAYQLNSDTAQPIQAAVTFYRGKQKVFETEPFTAQEGFKATAKALPVKLTVPLNTLTPGKYTCQVSIINTKADRVAFWRAPVAVLP